MLLTRTESPEDRLLWLRVSQTAGLLLPLPWGFFVAALESCLRTSKGCSRWRIKYLILGLGGIFLVRFYLLSHVLLFNVIMASYLATAAVQALHRPALLPEQVRLPGSVGEVSDSPPGSLTAR